MGLVLDGIWKDKHYDNQEMTAKQVAEIFDIKDEIYPKGKKKPSTILPFEYDKSKMKVVKGQQRMINSLSLPTMFSYSKNGETISLTYFEKRIPKRNELGMIEYQMQPRKVHLTKKVTPLSKQQKVDLAVYLALHTQCGSSPLFTKGSEKSFNLKNRDKDATVYLDMQRQKMKITDIIFGGEMEVVRVHAKGIGMLGVDEMEDDTVRAELSKLFDKHVKNDTIENFINKFNSPYSGVKGQVMECIDRGFIIREPGAAGTTVFKWSKETGSKGVLCHVPRGKEPIEYLLTYMFNNWNAYHNSIEDVLLHRHGGKKGELVDSFNEKLAQKAIEDRKPSELTSKELSSELINEGMVIYNPASKSIHFVKGKQMEDDPFMAAELTTWAQEFALRLEEDADLNKKCCQKLTGRRNAKK